MLTQNLHLNQQFKITNFIKKVNHIIFMILNNLFKIYKRIKIEVTQTLKVKLIKYSKIIITKIIKSLLKKTKIKIFKVNFNKKLWNKIKKM